jgi:putative oxidoreductase
VDVRGRLHNGKLTTYRTKPARKGRTAFFSAFKSGLAGWSNTVMAQKKSKLSVLRFAGLDNFSDHGLFIIRVGLGLMFALYHGWPKLIGGPDGWEHIGRAVSYLGIHGGYTVWGFLAALLECGGGVCLVLGLAARPVALALAGEMCVASIWSYFRYFPFGGWSQAAHPFELAIVFLGLFYLGPGKYSIDSEL